MYLTYNKKKFLIVREEENYFLVALKIRDKISVYFVAKSRIDKNRNIFGDNSAHVISCLKWEENLTKAEVNFVNKNIT